MGINKVNAVVYRVKFRKALGVDEIPAKVYGNDKCIKLLHTICNQCFVLIGIEV